MPSADPLPTPFPRTSSVHCSLSIDYDVDLDSIPTSSMRSTLVDAEIPSLCVKVRRKRLAKPVTTDATAPSVGPCKAASMAMPKSAPRLDGQGRRHADAVDPEWDLKKIRNLVRGTEDKIREAASDRVDEPLRVSIIRLATHIRLLELLDARERELRAARRAAGEMKRTQRTFPRSRRQADVEAIRRVLAPFERRQA